MADRMKCKNCGLVWFWAGYPYYIGCPRCGSTEQDPMKHEVMCPKCEGSGKILTCEEEIPEFDNTRTDGDACTVARNLLREGKYNLQKWDSDVKTPCGNECISPLTADCNPEICDYKKEALKGG